MNDLAVIEQILRNRQDFFAEIRDGLALRPKVRSMLVSSFVFLAIYGAVLGSTHSPAQALSSAVKLPILFLATLLVCVPTLYFFNVLFGSDQGIGQNVALILTAIVIGFGTQAFAIVLIKRVYQAVNTDDIDKIKKTDGS